MNFVVPSPRETEPYNKVRTKLETELESSEWGGGGGEGGKERCKTFKDRLRVLIFSIQFEIWSFHVLVSQRTGKTCTKNPETLRHVCDKRDCWKKERIPTYEGRGDGMCSEGR